METPRTGARIEHSGNEKLLALAKTRMTTWTFIFWQIHWHTKKWKSLQSLSSRSLTSSRTNTLYAFTNLDLEKSWLRTHRASPQKKILESASRVFIRRSKYNVFGSQQDLVRLSVCDNLILLTESFRYMLDCLEVFRELIDITWRSLGSDKGKVWVPWAVAPQAQQ